MSGFHKLGHTYTISHLLEILFSNELLSGVNNLLVTENNSRVVVMDTCNGTVQSKISMSSLMIFSSCFHFLSLSCPAYDVNI